MKTSLRFISIFLTIALLLPCFTGLAYAEEDAPNSSVTEQQDDGADGSTNEGTGEGTDEGTGEGTDEGTGEGTDEGTGEGADEGTGEDTGEGTFDGEDETSDENVPAPLDSSDPVLADLVISGSENISNWSFSNDGTYPWTYDADKAAWKSGNAGVNSSASTITMTLTTGKAIQLEVECWVSSETNYDWLKISVDGTETFSASGSKENWENGLALIESAGTHTVTFSFTKDGSSAGGSDAAWIKSITIAELADNSLKLQDANGVELTAYNDRTYPWTYEEGILVSGNANVDATSSSIKVCVPQGYKYLEFDILSQGEVSGSDGFTCYDGTEVRINGSKDPGFNMGLYTDTWRHKVVEFSNADAEDNYIIFTYVKDTGWSSEADCCTVKNLKLTAAGEASPVDETGIYASGLTVDKTGWLVEPMLGRNALVNSNRVGTNGEEVTATVTVPAGNSSLAFKALLSAWPDMTKYNDLWNWTEGAHYKKLTVSVNGDKQYLLFAGYKQLEDGSYEIGLIAVYDYKFDTHYVYDAYAEDPWVDLVVDLDPAKANTVTFTAYCRQDDDPSAYLGPENCFWITDLRTAQRTQLSPVLTDELTGNAVSFTQGEINTVSYLYNKAQTFRLNPGKTDTQTVYVLYDGKTLAANEDGSYTLPAGDKKNHTVEFWATEAGCAVSDRTFLKLRPDFSQAITGLLTAPGSSEMAISLTGNADGSYPWTFDGDWGAAVSTNQGVASSYSNMAVTVTGNGTLSVNYFTSSEANWDKLFYAVGAPVSADNAGTVVSSGVTSGSFDISVSGKADDEETIVYFAYGKDGSGNVNDDMVGIYSLKYIQGARTVSFGVQNQGSGTAAAAVDGEELENGTTVSSGTQVTFTATPAEGNVFYAWVDENGDIVNENAEFTVIVSEDLSYSAVMAPAGTYVAKILNGGLYESLHTAADAAEAGDTIRLLENVTLDRDLTIPADVTLLMPCADTDVDGTNNSLGSLSRPAWTQESTYLYRSLNIPENVTLTVNGTLIVGGIYGVPGSMQCAQGITSGSYTQLVADGRVNVNGTLNIYGLVKGSGTVEAGSAATLSLPFVINDYSGGTNLFALVNAGVFPFQQYGIMNLQTKLVMQSGGTMIGKGVIYGMSADVPFVGGEGSFLQLGENTALTMTYDASKFVNVTLPGSGASCYLQDTGKVSFTLDGDAVISGMTVTVLGNTVSSADYDALCLPYNIDFVVESGTLTMVNSYRVMPGSTVTINQGAGLKLDSGSKLHVMDGWYQPAMSGKRYPTSDQLKASGFSQSGNLIVNGTLEIADGAEFAGIIQTTGTTGIVKTGANAKLGLVEEDDMAVTGAEGYSNTMVGYLLRARIVHEGIFKDLVPEAEYRALGGELWTLDNYTMITAVDAEADENYTGTTVTINQQMQGAWWDASHPWYTDENGTTYFKDGVRLKDTWQTIDGNTYYFNEDGYILKGIQNLGQDGEIQLYAFDCDTGVFLENATGVFTDSNGDIYWIENGIAVENKGLTKVVLDDGHIHYYYFGCGVADCESEVCQGQYASYKAQRSCYHWVEITNGYLVQWGYTFDEYGVILHDEDTSKNGVCEDSGIKFYYMDGVKVHYGLFIGEDGGYYYAKSDGSLVAGRDYWISKTNDLLPEQSYTFDEDGRIVNPPVTDPDDPEPEEKDGIVAEYGSLYYYVDGKLTYAGLIQIDGSYYYVRTSGEVVHGRSYWITKTNGLMDEGSYTFGDDGKMILPEAPKNGIVAENESLYYYVDGSLTYAGLIQIDGSYYYVRTSGEVVHGRSYWISKTNGLLPEGSYTFDDDGRMVNPPATDPIDPEEPEVKNGIVAEYGSLYYYVDGQLTYAGLIQIDGDYYYVRTSGEVVHGRSYWITKTNGLLPQGSYQFADDGKLIRS